MTAATLLIVDDEPANLAVLAWVLRPHYRVRAASSGERALQAALTPPLPDLILLDVMMPDMDGHAVLTRLRENPATRDIPVIFVTALDDEASEERGLKLGAVDYIAKPVKPAIVLARVATQLELKQARDRLTAQNTWLESEVARRMAENQLIQDVSIHALGYLAETRDPETGNHIHRTQQYVHALAWELSDHPRFAAQLDDHAIQLLVKSAPLHDIGYPDGLAGEAIPLSARLMALADVFDALVTRRVYKPALPVAEARDIIAGERGRHFDPDVVAAFLANFAVFAAVAEACADPGAAAH